MAKEDGEIKSVDPESLTYGSARPVQLPALPGISRLRAVEDRLRALYESGWAFGRLLSGYDAGFAGVRCAKNP